MRSVNGFIPITDVTIEDNFWAPRREVNKNETIPYQYEQLQKVGQLDSLRLENPLKAGIDVHQFWDSDVAKWIEAASYTLATEYDEKLDSKVDEVIQLLADNQHDDGYLNTYFTKVKPGARWTDLRDAHELYCAGHLIEAGVAHYKATQKRNLLNVITKYADYIDTVFGLEKGKLKGYPGHQEIELALVKLYEVTNNDKYLNLSAYFINERGKNPHYFEKESKEYGPGLFEELFSTFPDLKEYNQSHKPVRKQTKVVGHSVRALYMYSAMADLVRELGDQELKRACDALWDNLNNRNTYITGGIGSTDLYEGFTFDYDLPNESAYAETCAAISAVFWNQRMLKLESNSKYADAMEKALYNGVISGISLDGKKYFYDNRLESLGDIDREEWFGVACCPPNIARLMASLGEYIYSKNEDNLFVHLFIQGSAKFKINNEDVLLKQYTNYPWSGDIKLQVDMKKSQRFTVNLRVPNWARNVSVKINGADFVLEEKIKNGYIELDREWESGDTIEMELPMTPERVYSNKHVRQNINCVAIQRGPLVYCIEGIDNGENIQTISLPNDTTLSSNYDEDLLGGVVEITGEARQLISNDDSELYRFERQEEEDIKLTAIPYYAWNNRGKSSMNVWIPEV